jgi:hypothetical protein
MSDAVSLALEAYKTSAQYEALELAFACECAERVRHLLEDENVRRCLDILQAYVKGRGDRRALRPLSPPL